MADGPSALGLIVLTGMTITAVVSLYAYDAIPRRDGMAPSTDIWQSPQYERSYNAAPSQNTAPASQPNDQQQPQDYSPPKQQQQQQQPYPQGQSGQYPADVPETPQPDDQRQR